MLDVALAAEEAAEQQETDWALHEFGAAQLGDARRTARLVRLARQLSIQPQASLPEACGDRATLKAAYRFFDNDAVSDADLLASPIQATSARVAAEPLVLAVQETTVLDWTAHPATTGLGMVATVQQQGLLVHSTVAVTPERAPWGLLGDCWANRSGSAIRPRWARSTSGGSAPRPRKSARSGCAAWLRWRRCMSSAARPTCSAWATARPLSTTCSLPRVQPASICWYARGSRGG